ncbi:hypothetical protein QYF36_018753 [Acer negundo]|nr:hypothetical protein QYF36_018753 [Acer negundo]
MHITCANHLKVRPPLHQYIRKLLFSDLDKSSIEHVLRQLRKLPCSDFVVDEVLEEIRLGLELNDYGMQQRRIAHMRFLGELYNYEHVDSSVIFDTLYLILIYGHSTSEQDVLIHQMIVSASEWLLHFLRLMGTTLTEDIPRGNLIDS